MLGMTIRSFTQRHRGHGETAGGINPPVFSMVPCEGLKHALGNMGNPNIAKANISAWIVAILITIVIGSIIAWFAYDVGLNRIMFAFWVNWLLMFWAYGIHRTNTVKLPERYFHIRPIERKVYRFLGVGCYQRLIRRVNIFNPELHLKEGRSGLVKLEQATRDAEQAHALIYIIVSGFTLYALFRRWWMVAFWYFVFNMLLNGYPVMVQRYNRDRINRILRRRR